MRFAPAFLKIAGGRFETYLHGICITYPRDNKKISHDNKTNPNDNKKKPHDNKNISHDNKKSSGLLPPSCPFLFR